MSAFEVRADIALTRWNVRYWHLSGHSNRSLNVRFGGKADITNSRCHDRPGPYFLLQ